MVTFKQWCLFISFLLLCVLNSNTQEEQCRTPDGENGSCISLDGCDGLKLLLRSQSNNPRVRIYLQRSTCGFIGNLPKVCCQSSRIQTSSETPNEITSSQPVTSATTTTTSTPVTKNPDNGNSQKYQLLRPPQCGVTKAKNGRIVGGVPAKLGEIPWIAALGYKNSKNSNQPRWLCGGSLITKKHILTAGHCVKNRPDLYLARLGELDLYDDNDGATPLTIPLIKAAVHEEYNPTSFTNDIAVLTLEYEAEGTYITPVCLPLDEPLRAQNFFKYNGIVAGWGATNFNGPSSSALQLVQLPVHNTDVCKQAFTTFKTAVIDERILCVGLLQGGKDSCQGDSGGPYVIGKPEGKTAYFYQIGVVSYGFRCAEPGYPGVYSRVTQFLDWIETKLD